MIMLMLMTKVVIKHTALGTGRGVPRLLDGGGGVDAHGDPSEDTFVIVFTCQQTQRILSERWKLTGSTRSQERPLHEWIILGRRCVWGERIFFVSYDLILIPEVVLGALKEYS